MAGTTPRDQAPKIEDHLFGSESEADDVGVAAAHNRAMLVSRLESLPETAPEPDDALRRELVDGFSIHPAQLMPARMTCKRVRFSSSSNRTHSAVRVDIPYEGNGEALRWHVQQDMIDASQPYWDRDGRPGRMLQHWSVGEGEGLASFYAILPPTGGDSEAEAENAAAGLAPRIRHVMDVLASMRRVADEWNRSMPALMEQVVADRKEGIARREAFLRKFRDKVAYLLLPSTP